MKLQKKSQEDILVVQEHLQRDAKGNELVLPLLHYPLLDQTGIVEHCFTTRLGGVSEGVCSSLNLSFSSADFSILDT